MSVAAAQLLQTLRERGVTLSADGDQLRYRAPRGALTDELRAAIAQHRDEVLKLLSQPNRWDQALADAWIAVTVQRISDQHDRLPDGPGWDEAEALVGAAYECHNMTALRDALAAYERHAEKAFAERGRTNR